MADTDLTELVEINPTRVDLVKTPANGFPFLVIKAVNAKGEVDEKPDIANAEKVLKLLAQLIQAEAAEMAAGEWDEVCDIEMLTSAAYMIKCFRSREQMSAEGDSISKSLESAIVGRATEMGVPDPMTDTASKDTTVTDTIPDPTTETVPTTTEAPAEKSAVQDFTEAVAKAVAPLEEVIKGLRDEMAAIKATPIPGAPAVTAMVAKSAAQESAVAKELARMERLAKDTQDRELARYYADRAAELKGK